MPGVVEDESSFSSNDSTLVASPRRRDFTSLHDALLAKYQEKDTIGNLLNEALSLGYEVLINYRPTKKTKKGPARDSEIFQVTDAQDTARCTWGQHTDCSVSQRAILKILPGQIRLRSYCEDGKQKNYDFLYDEDGKHVLNGQVSLPSFLPLMSPTARHPFGAALDSEGDSFLELTNNV